MTGCLPTVSANFDTDCMRSRPQANLDAIERAAEGRRPWYIGDELVAWRRWRSSIPPAARSTINGKARADRRARRPHRAAARQRQAHGADRTNCDARMEPRLGGQPTTRVRTHGEAAAVRAARKFMNEFGAVLEHFANRDDVTFARPDLIQCDAQVAATSSTATRYSPTRTISRRASSSDSATSSARLTIDERARAGRQHRRCRARG